MSSARAEYLEVQRALVWRWYWLRLRSAEADNVAALRQEQYDRKRCVMCSFRNCALLLVLTERRRRRCCVWCPGRGARASSCLRRAPLQAASHRPPATRGASARSASSWRARRRASVASARLACASPSSTRSCPGPATLLPRRRRSPREMPWRMRARPASRGPSTSCQSPPGVTQPSPSQRPAARSCSPRYVPAQCGGGSVAAGWACSHTLRVAYTTACTPLRQRSRHCATP